MEPDLLELRSYLKEEYGTRTRLNRLYSRKAFSRDLGISATCLNDFLSGKRALSFQNIDRIFKYLGKRRSGACSWCGRAKKESKRMIGGPRRQFICEGCVDVCNDILKTGRKMPVQ